MTKSRPGLILALVCLPVFVGALDLTIISAVLPAVIADLNIPLQTGLDDAAWAVNGYLLAYAVSMTFMGRVSDLWGRRRVYLICLAIFFLGSWWVAASGGAPAELAYRIARFIVGGRPDRSLMALYALIFGRVVQAFGAGAMVPVSMALVADLYPPQRRALPLGLVGAVDTAGWVLGHLYGGIVVQFFAWPFLFWINLPVVAIMFGLTAWALRGLPSMKSEGRVDWIGAGLISLALVGLNLGLGAGEAASASPPPYAAPALLIAALCFVLFLWAERRAANPLLDLRVFAERNVSAGSGMNLLVGFCLMVGLVSVPLFINVAGGADSGQGALVSGYLLSAFTVPMALAAIPGGWLTERLGYRWTAALGVSVALIGFILMSRWQAEMAGQAVAVVAGGGTPEAVNGTLQMIAGLLLAGVGLGLTVAPIGTAVINGVAESQRGMASALVIILRLIGMSVSISALTAYGLRRSTEISRHLLEGVALTDFARLAEAALQAVTRVTAEMALIAAAACAVALIPAFLLGRDPKVG
jgi:MFS family permease